MRKILGGALGAVLIGALAFAAISWGAAPRASVATVDGADPRAAAPRATDTYRGKFKQAGPRAKIKIEAKRRNGEARSVKALTYGRLPATCEESGPQLVSDGWRFRGFKVDDRRRFSIVGQAADGSTINFTGRFSKSFNKVKGRFQSDIEFAAPDPKPEETCVTQTKAYGAKR